MTHPDIYWHPLNNGLRWHQTQYALYISIFRLQINIPLPRK